MNKVRYWLLRYICALALLGGAVLLAGCVSVPETLRGGPEQSPAPAQVSSAPERYAGTTVRWGGVIVAVENSAAQSVVEVVARPLARDARPLETGQTTGRFLVHIAGFIDPLDYAAGRELTVVGTLQTAEQRVVGAYPYHYPVVRATAYYLWPVRPLYVHDPYLYPPFYDPWYPFGPYPRYYPYPYPYPHHHPRKE